MRIDQPDMRGAQAEIRGAHADRDAPHVAADVASNTLDNRSLTEIAEELASIEAIGSVMESEIDILEVKHREETTRHKEGQNSALCIGKTESIAKRRIRQLKFETEGGNGRNKKKYFTK